ncbi:MAG: 3-isopropylmalate dehydratase [bacterium]
METVFRGRVWKFGDNISTDLMMPGTETLGQLGLKQEVDWQAMARNCMQANRPGWAELVQQGDLLVAGRNFGCGSARPAPRFLKVLGISVVLAESIARVFLRNSVNLGFPALICRGISPAVEEGDILEVDISSGQVRNLRSGRTLEAEGFPQGSPPYDILMAGGLKPFLARGGRQSS